MKKDGSRAKLDFERPLVTVDLAIFCVLEETLKVLLVQRPRVADEPFPGEWALPGGFIDVAIDASLEACALRKLREKTGVKAPYLEQLASWGDAERDPRGWSATHAYFALIDATRPEARLEESNAAQWMAAGAPITRRMAFDHARILATALARLRGKVEYTSLPAFLLAEPFTLPQLQQQWRMSWMCRMCGTVF